MTPKECFEFALKITSYVTNEECERRCDELISRLGLKSCSNVMCGDGKFIKGISGGERKRTTIG
jgi:ABC-type multidrug transport system ATPase subunit